MTNFSVLMPVYYGDTKENFIEALNSVTRLQTLKPSEVVIVVDGQVDWLKAGPIAEDYSEYNVQFVQIERNLGLTNALNIGLEHCENELIARMDSDDVAVCNRFEMQIPIISMQEQVAAIGGSVQEFDGIQMGGKRACPSDPIEIRKHAYLRNPMNHPTVIMRKCHVMSVGGYHDFDGFEDYDLWVRLMQKGKRILNINEICVRMRTNPKFYGRRRGLDYVKKEYRFALNLYKQGFLTKWKLMKFMITRLFMRLMPKKFIVFVYSKILRKR